MPTDGASLTDGFASLFKPGVGLARGLAQQSVRRVTIRSQFLPPIVLEPRFTVGPDGEPQPATPSPFSFGALVRPSIDVEGAFGTAHYAPYGEPSDNYLPYMVGAGALLVAGGSLFCGLAKVAKYAALAGAGIAAAGYLRNRLGASS